MTEPQFFVTPGIGTMFHEQLHLSQSVRLGDVVHISGQGGWDDDLHFPDDLEQGIVRAFDNVERVLASPRTRLATVTSVMTQEFRGRMGERAPVWTQVGVPALGAVGVRVEIRVTAVTPAPNGA